MSKQALQGIIQKIQNKKFEDEKSKGLLSAIQQEQTKALQPVLENMAKSMAESMTKAMMQSVANLKVDAPKIDMPEIRMPEIPPVQIPPIRVPEAKVTVNVPPVEVPQLSWPEGEMPITGWVKMMGYDVSLLKNPFPVQLRDKNGKPIDFGSMSFPFSSGGGGNVVVQNDANHPIPVTGSFTASQGATYFASDAILSVNVIQSLGNQTVVGGGYQDNALRVTHATDAIVSVRVDSSSASVAANIVDSGGVAYSGSNPIPITTAANTLDIKQVSGSVDSVNLLQVNSNPVVVGTGYQDNALRVTHATDAIVSVRVDGSSASVAATILNGDGSTRDSWQVSGIVASVAAALVDSGGVQYSGSNPLPIATAATTLDIKQVSGSIDSVNLQQINGSPVVVGAGWKDNALRTVEAQDSVVSTNLMQTLGNPTVVGTGYQDNALRVVHATDAVVSVNVLSGSTVNVNGATNSVVATGPIVADNADDGSAPIQTGGIVRQANPTAYHAGDVAKSSYDDLGRQLIRPVQARDLVTTAYATLTTGTEATLLAATAGAMYDLIYITGANQSTAAVQIDVRGITAGNVLLTLYIPAQSTAGVALPVPLPQTSVDTGNAWTVDMPDITGTTVNISALFSKEI